jgi:hypothetical protein
MDYRVALGDCDPQLELVVPGGWNFIEQRSAALVSGLVLPQYKTMWVRARNEVVRTTRRLVPIATTPLAGPFEILLDVSS